MQTMPQMEPRMKHPHVILQREPVKNRPDTVVEEKLESMETSPHAVFDYNKAIQLFRISVETNRQGESREIETEFQNRIIRYMLHKPLSQIDPLLQKISSEAQKTSSKPGMNKAFTTAKNQLLRGIESVIEVLRELEVQFHKDRLAGKTPSSAQLFLGTNNKLDAKSAIDVISIEYEPEQAPKRIELHQVKSRRGPPVNSEEIRIIQDKHAEFVKSLATRDYAASYKWSRELLKREEVKFNEILLAFREKKSPKAIFEILAHYDDLMVAILAEPPVDISEDSLEEYINIYAPDASLHMLYTFFHYKSYEELVTTFNSNNKLNPAQQKTISALHSWCLGYLPPLEKIQALHEQLDFDPNHPSYITRDTEFWSVIDHAGKPIIKRL